MSVPQSFIVAQGALLQATAGGVSQAAGAGGVTNVALTVATPGPVAPATLTLTNRRQIMMRLIMQCTAVPTANGTITIKDRSGGTVIFNVEAQTTMTAGTQLSFVFDTPLRSFDDTALAGGFSFVVDMPANTGTWRFYVVGFSADSQTLS
jgi:hypothetical protein